MVDTTSTATLAAAFAAALATVLPAQAAEQNYNQISLRAEASQEVPNDIMRVVFFSEARDEDPTALANKITQNINLALEKAKKVNGITIKTGNRVSYPVNADSSILSKSSKAFTGWNERAEIVLESRDFLALSKLTGDLQEHVQIASMQFLVARQTQQKAEDALLTQAVEAFQKRAEITTKALGGKGYKIVNLNLNSSGFGGAMPMMMERAKAASYAPNVEAGNSNINMIADGIIEVFN